jgi:hypothetical protein
MESGCYLSAEKFSAREAALYLAAYIDGEGCVYFRRCTLASGKHHQARVVTISSTDPELADAVCICLAILGIDFFRGSRPPATPTRKPVSVIEIRRGAAMWRLRQIVPIQSARKRQRLDEALLSYRGLHCAGCGCLHDEETAGCTNCRKRHYFRAASRRCRDKKAAA